MPSEVDKDSFKIRCNLCTLVRKNLGLCLPSNTSRIRFKIVGRDITLECIFRVEGIAIFIGDELAMEDDREWNFCYAQPDALEQAEQVVNRFINKRPIQLLDDEIWSNYDRYQIR